MQGCRSFDCNSYWDLLSRKSAMMFSVFDSVCQTHMMFAVQLMQSVHQIIVE